MRRRSGIGWASALVFSRAVILSVSASAPVKVSLRTSWSETPIFLEAIEAVTMESPSAFFPLIDVLTDPEKSPYTSQLTPEAIHERTLQTALALGYLDEPGSLESARLQLALHATSPKVQAFYQFYNDEHFPPLENCESWVDWYGERICDVEALAHLAGHDTINAVDGTDRTYLRPKLLPFDHIYPAPSKSLLPPPRTAILYASPSSHNFRDLHTYLYKLATAREPRVEYIMRFSPPANRSHEKTYLSGYGVALDLKKTDYLAVDDRQTGKKDTSKSNGSENGSNEDEDPIYSILRAYPEKAQDDLGEREEGGKGPGLTEKELQTIGSEVAQLVVNSANPVRTLAQVVQNFPKYAKAIAERVEATEDLKIELMGNGFLVQGGVSAIWFNGGSAIPIGDITALSLLRVMRRERATVLSLTSLGLSPSQAISLLTHPTIAEAQNQEGPRGLDGFVDASDRPEGGDLILWLNDIANDERYARWSPSIIGLVSPAFPGAMPHVRRNVFNVVLVLDFSQSKSLHLVAGTLNAFISRGVALRFGVVPSVETEEAQRMARLVYYLVKHFDITKAMGFLSRVSQMHTPPRLMPLSVDWDLVRSEFSTLLHNYAPQDDVPTDLDAILDGTSDPDSGLIEKARQYAQRLDAKKVSSPDGHAFVNGKHIDVDDELIRYIQVEVSSQLQVLQERIYDNELVDEQAETIDTYFYDLPTSAKRRNRYVYPQPFTAGMQLFNLPEVFARSGVKYDGGAFLYPGAETAPMTVYIIADLDSPKGMALMSNAIAALKLESSARLSFIHNPIGVDADEQPAHRHISPITSYLVSNSLFTQISAEDFAVHLNAHSEVPDEAASQTILSGNSAVYQLLKDSGHAVESLAESEAYKDFCSKGLVLSKEFGLKPGDAAILVNGRIVGPLDATAFSAEDFLLLEEYELRKRATPVVSALSQISVVPEKFTKAAYSDLVSLASSVVSSVLVPDPSEKGLFNTAPRPRQRGYQRLARNHTGFEFGDPETAIYHFGILLDPLSETAQKWSSILEWLITLPSVYVEVYLNPAPYAEAPLKRFYRYNLPSALSFDENGNEIRSETVFEGLPVEPIYTLAMDVPPSWLVRPREAVQDLDNIQLANTPDGVEATFELDYLVIEGHARDAATNHPPRGLQLQLSTIDGAPVDDTQVVANLGYLQFKAKPGVFQLEIREGRGRDVFTMESVGNEGWNSPNVSEVGVEVTLTSFEGMTLYPRVRRKPGMERADVLDEFIVVDQQPKGFFDQVTSRVASLFRPGGETNKAIAPRQADINIFTVASGLLYERFASIMILSVLKNTKSTVKFWFIENFLSPSFLEFIPHFAQAYGFEYELVTYKWPSWLRAQKEKQRIIWAYKILFLDVLFPMDLKKVIFVDADQIVRTDLKELVDLDLHGAPYGYTPMGDDNTEMEGFRFWKTGYWKDFLKGKPYHISALYVVDLARFRQIAAGDILRQHYQQLSADPNSLANLDQDLPNNLQREVPIFSLHEDWLWCETWCNKDRLDRAKTIDLCQNPLTKEPKLSRARQIPEWSAYDSEIAAFARKLADEGVIKSDMAAADANALASGSSNTNAAEVVSETSASDVEGSGAEVAEDREDNIAHIHVKDEL